MLLSTLSRAAMQATNRRIKKVSNKLELINAQAFIDNKSRQSKVAAGRFNFSFKLGGVLAVAMLMTGCKPTVAT